MRVAALIHFYPPFRCAGSETVAHELFKAAVQAGHDVTVWITNKDAKQAWRGTEPDTTVDGVLVKRVRNSIVGAQRLKAWKPDVVFSHHQHVLPAIKAARQIGARSVFATHNSYEMNARPLRANPDLVIHNSRHVAETLAKYGGQYRSMIFHPPLTPERHKVESTGEALTLVNLNRDKGADLFYALAEAEPDRKFLGVVGGHGIQVVRRNLPNVTILPHGPDMQRVWSATRVLLMPSEFESYGLVAVEAGVNGIPTIAHPTTGLQENLGRDGLFADRDRITEWQNHITMLDDPDVYEYASNGALLLAENAMSDTRNALNDWLAWLAA